MKKIIFIFTIILITLTLPLSAFGASSRKGIDVSFYQGNIDFRSVRHDRVEYVYIRAGEGTNIVDSKFEQNYARARDAHLKIGFYHFVTARNIHQARNQAHFFARLINAKDMELRPAMDFEQLSGLTKKECNDIARVYLETLERLTGKRPTLYSNAYDVQTVWEKELKKYPLWVADYGRDEPYTTGVWEDWSGFQYSDKGEVTGIRGHVDLDRFTSEMLLTEREKDPKNIKYTSYKVKRDDTIEKIAKKYNMTREDLMELNYIDVEEDDYIIVEI